MTWATDIGEKNKDDNVTPGPSEWDQLLIAGSPCPGIVTVELSLSADIDKKKPKGVRKSQAVDRGAKPAKARITIRLQPSELKIFADKIVPLLFAKGKDAAQDPLELSHPELELWGINLFIIEDLTSSPPEPGGLKEIAFAAMEYVAQPKAVKPKGIRTVEDLAASVQANVVPAAQNLVDKLFNAGRSLL